MKDSILIVAGENSGEKYGADLVHQFKRLQSSCSFFGIGGKHMKKEGVHLLFPVEALSIVGGIEVISHLPRVRNIFNRIKKEIRRQKPIVSVLIDSPDFNLRLAKKLKKLSIPVLYYISPTVWAWRKRRLRSIKKAIEKMMLIFPFEEKIYEEYKIPAIYIGHPLKERVKASLSKEEFLQKYGFDPERKLIALLPGSRKSELKYHLPVLLEAVKKIKKEYPTQFVLILAESLDKNLLADFISPHFKELKVITENGYEAIASSELALSACGTANLEAALLETPVISFYRISPLTYHIGVRFITIKNYSIVNILAGKQIIPELIQKDFSSENIFQEAKKILDSESVGSKMIKEFRKIEQILGDEIASKNAAQELEKLIKQKTT